MEWFEIENSTPKKFPSWVRSFAINQDGIVFVAGAITNVPEEEIYRCTFFDNTPSVLYKKHRYFPTKWLAREYPEVAELCAIIDSQAAKVLADATG